MKWLALSGLVTVVGLLIWRRANRWIGEDDWTHRRASRVWRGVDYEGL